MTASFSRPAARVRRGNAPVKLRCSGTATNRCIGTLVLRGGGTTQKAVFSIRRGDSAIVKVRLSARLRRLVATRTVRVRVLARTAQTSGGPVLSSRFLRLK